MVPQVWRHFRPELYIGFVFHESFFGLALCAIHRCAGHHYLRAAFTGVLPEPSVSVVLRTHLTLSWHRLELRGRPIAEYLNDGLLIEHRTHPRGPCSTYL